MSTIQCAEAGEAGHASQQSTRSSGPTVPWGVAVNAPIPVHIPWPAERPGAASKGDGVVHVDIEKEIIVSISNLGGPCALAALFALFLGRTGAQEQYDLTLVAEAGMPPVRFAPDPEQPTVSELRRAAEVLETSLGALRAGFPVQASAEDDRPPAVMPAGVLAGGRGQDLPALTFDPSLDEADGPRLVYDEQRLSREDAGVLAASLAAFAHGVAEEPGRPLGRQPLLDTETRHRLLAVWNPAPVAFPDSLCVHGAFEAQVDATPDAPALSLEDETLTYAELDARANRLAHLLRRRGVGPDALVGVHLGRRLELVVAALAVQKAGGAYVALDPTYPPERIRLMIEDSGTRLIVTQPELVQGLAAGDADVILVGDAEGEPATRPAAVACPADLAYAIYTSGSTGRPKGVLVEHRNVLNFFTGMDAVVPRADGADGSPGVWLAVTTLSFDISVLELFYTLARGFHVVLLGDRMRAVETGHTFSVLARRHAVTHLQTTPSMALMLLETAETRAALLAIPHLFFGGEAFPRCLVDELIPGHEGTITNMYGPTETTIWSSTRRVDGSPGAVPIGSPIANNAFYVLDERGELVPPGAPGELHIGGAGVVRGYHCRPELDAKQFVPHPLRPESGERVYRTGDLVRWRNDGAMEFLGRMDQQVKVRGFRIELGEIETAIAARDDVAECVVVARAFGDADMRLVAYVVARGSVPDTRSVRAWVGDRLPPYMVPQHVVALERFPHTPNGKIDRKALPGPEGVDGTDAGADPDTVAPALEDEVQETIASVWRDLLGVSEIGPEDTFFDLGGHSLLGIRAMTALNGRLGTQLAPVILFEHPAVWELADAFRQANPALAGTGGPTRRREIRPSSHEDGAQGADLDRILAAVRAGTGSTGVGATAGGRARRRESMRQGKRYGMRRSRFAARILAPLYALKFARMRSLIQYLILRLEGGAWFSVTLRELYAKHHDLHIGDYAGDCFDVGSFKPGTRIGRYCSIFRSARIETANHPSTTISSHGIFYQPRPGFADGYSIPRNRVEIGHDVHIGHNASILYPCSRIGDGAIIGAGTVVDFEVPPYAVVAGWPAQVVRYRFSKETIAKLVASRWWEASLEDLEAVKDEFVRPLEGKHVR